MVQLKPLNEWRTLQENIPLTLIKRGGRVRGSPYVLGAAVAIAGVVAYIASATGDTGGDASPVFGVTLPIGYRDWKLISVAHEEGNNNDLRAVLGNDVATLFSLTTRPDEWNRIGDADD